MVPGAHVPAMPDIKNSHVTSRATQLSTEVCDLS